MDSMSWFGKGVVSRLEDYHLECYADFYWSHLGVFGYAPKGPWHFAAQDFIE